MLTVEENAAAALLDQLEALSAGRPLWRVEEAARNPGVLLIKTSDGELLACFDKEAPLYAAALTVAAVNSLDLLLVFARMGLAAAAEGRAGGRSPLRGGAADGAICAHCGSLELERVPCGAHRGRRAIELRCTDCGARLTTIGRTVAATHRGGVA